MGQTGGAIATFGRFCAHTVLMPLRAHPPSWTAVQMYWSPALPNPDRREDAGVGILKEGSTPKGSGTSTPTNNKSSAATPMNEEAEGIGRSAEEEESQGPQIEPAVPELRSVLLDNCPSLRSTSHYRPTPWLASGHLQTIYSALVDTTLEDKVLYKRRVLLLPDGGTLSLDFSPPELAEEDHESTVPTVVCLHGLTGGSGETYVRNCFKPLTKPKSEGGKGFRGVVVNFRSCADTPLTSPQLYSASKTSDLRCALLFLTRLFPQSPLAGVGFSLGANILAKYMGEEGDATPLRGAMVLGAPFDCLRGSAVLELPGLNRGVYSKKMAGNLHRVIGRGIDVLTLDPEVEREVVQKLLHPPEAEVLMKERGIHAGTLKHVDDTGTRLLGGHRKPYGEFPFDTANEYYVGASSLNVLHAVRRPLLCFNAWDDPVVPTELCKPVMTIMGLRDEVKPEVGIHVHKRRAGNPNIVLALTPQGGHLGWWSGLKPKRWISAPIVEYLATVLEQEAFSRVGGAAKHAHNQLGRVREQQVDVDILPLSALRRYEDPLADSGGPAPPAAFGLKKPQQAEDEDQQQADAATELHEAEKEGPAAGGPGNDQLAWLTTRILEHAPLVHPFHHKYYQGEKGAARRKAVLDSAERRGRQAAARTRSNGTGIDGKGDGSDAHTHHEIISGQVKLTMVLDTTRPEVGYAELTPAMRVAGAGDVFVGAMDIPGGARDDAAARKREGVIAGL